MFYLSYLFSTSPLTPQISFKNFHVEVFSFFFSFFLSFILTLMDDEESFQPQAIWACGHKANIGVEKGLLAYTDSPKAQQISLLSGK